MEATHRLFQELKPEYKGLKILRNHTAPSVNVIAVHGIAAHPIETWVDEDEKWNWLEKELVQLIPRARVWTFGYDSSWSGDFSVDTTINEAAESLLDAIAVHNLLPTPLMFVAHSFGGIVVLKSLMMAEDPGNQWSTDGKALNLFKFTELILFFGTPFGGIDDWFQNDLFVHAKELLPIVRNDAFHSFRKDSPSLLELRRDFVNKCRSYKKPNVGCFWETYEVGKIVENDTVRPILLVDENSAVLRLPYPPWQCAYQLYRNHFNMHKFGPRTSQFDDTIKYVLHRIKFCIRAFCLDDLGHCFNPDEEKCLNSLAFPEMNLREQNVINALENTGIWLLQDSEYQQWLDQRHGVFWIKGDPGVGKSTIMKTISRHAIKDENIIVVSYFFHGTGALVQRDILGMIRSLLHQLMGQSPDLCSKITYIFFAKRGYNFEWEWSHKDLQETFLICVAEAAKAYHIRIYIDALDECNEEAVVPILDFFQGVANSVSLCFSCRRHFPLAASKGESEVWVERNNARDIETYLRHYFGQDMVQVRDRILQKKPTNFLWVKLVTNQVRSLINRDHPIKAILKKIVCLPIGLDELYEQSFNDIDESDRKPSLRLFQWICFALRPLSLQEVRVAMTVDEDTLHCSIDEPQESELYIKNDEAMIERICDLSQGLVEIPKHTSFSYGEENIWYGNVQVIHQTVYDFFVQRGLKLLYESLNKGLDGGTLIAWSHFRLSRSCIQYLSRTEVHNLGLKLDADRLFDSNLLIDEIDQIAHDRYPFLIYATELCCQHAEFVERGNVSQDDLLLYFVFNSESPTSLFFSWINIFGNLFGFYLEPDGTPLGSSLVHYACKNGLLSVLNSALGQGVKMNFFSDRGETPLFWAIRGGQEAVVKWLLDREIVNADFSHCGDDTALCLAAKLGHEAIVRILLQQHDTTTSGSSVGYKPLFHAAEHGQEPVVRLLLQRDNVATDSRSSNRSKALYRAAMRGHESVVKLLLEQDDVTADFRNPNNYTPLAVAASSGHEAVVKLLLERDDVTANTRASDTDESTPLYMAARRGHVAVLKLLLEVDEIKADRDDIERSLNQAYEAELYGGRSNKEAYQGKTIEEAVELLEQQLARFPNVVPSIPLHSKLYTANP